MYYLLSHTGVYLAYGSGSTPPQGKYFVEINTLHHVVWPNILGRGIVTQFKIEIYPDYPLFTIYV